MAHKLIELVTGSLEQKKQYKRDKARIEALPEPYRGVAKAVERYTLSTGGVLDGEILLKMYADLTDLWERASLENTPIRSIVGDDPVGFVEDFVESYGGKTWMEKERVRLVKAVEAAE